MEEREYAPYILRAMADAVFLVDLRDRITLTNGAASRLLGFSADQLRGRKLATLFADQEAAIRSSTRLQMVVDGAEIHREELELLAADGTHIPVSLTGSPVLDSSSDLVGIVLVARDLRETRRLLSLARAAEQELSRAKQSVEEELEETRKQLLHADRLATLGTLAGGLGHELANVASVFTACLDRLEELEERGDLSGLMMRAYARACQHLVDHSRRLKSLAQPGPDFEEPLDLRDIITGTIEMLHQAGKTRRIEVTTELPDEPLVVRVNRTRIEQILVNLIVNSADALSGRPGARIWIPLGLDRERGRARCRVADNGAGIPPESLDRVFDSFYTTKPEGVGTGLGLAVVKQIVESYDGSISISSELGQGTEIEFDLPAET